MFDQELIFRTPFDGNHVAGKKFKTPCDWKHIPGRNGTPRTKIDSTVIAKYKAEGRHLPGMNGTVRTVIDRPELSRTMKRIPSLRKHLFTLKKPRHQMLITDYFGKQSKRRSLSQSIRRK
jgi:hypothetical protein